jgi:glycosyltransferase involved in cell wall biosynthesis
MPRRQGATTVYVAWTSRPGRVKDVSAALGAHPFAIFPRPRLPLRLPHATATAIRYLVSLVLTVAELARSRPRTIIATNPPMFPPLVAWGWSRLTRGTFVMDSHPSAFGAKGKRTLERLQPLHRWLARRAAAVLVTTPARAAEVQSWGGTGLVVHEAPATFPPPARGPATAVLFVGVFAPDEPVDAVVAAAAAVPEVEFRLTGDPTQAPPGLLEALPPNVTCVGYLDADTYATEIAAATLILTLTTEPSSVMRSAYEAVYARVPLITSDTPVLRDVFPYALHCESTPESIATAVREGLASLQTMRANTDLALELQRRRWDEQLAKLIEVCGSA